VRLRTYLLVRITDNAHTNAVPIYFLIQPHTRLNTIGDPFMKKLSQVLFVASAVLASSYSLAKSDVDYNYVGCLLYTSDAADDM
jgi:hypothetical protein